MGYKIFVENFQALEKVSLEIEGFTVILGSNNHGKSSLVRSIHALFSNMGGDDFVKIGAKHCRVGFVFPDGHKVLWVKGSGKNSYKLGSGKSWDKVGHEVPQEILDLGIRPIEVRKKKIWPQFARQITGQMFLLNETASFLAEAISDTDRVNIYTKALTESESDTRRVKAELRVKRQDLIEVDASISNYQGFLEIEKQVEEIERLEAEKSRLELEIPKLQYLNAKLVKVDEDLEKIPDLEISLGDLEGLKNLYRKKKKLEEIFQNFQKIEGREISIPEFEIPKENIFFKLEEKNILLEKQKKLKNAYEEILKKEEALVKREAGLKKSHEDICSQLEGGECPLCGGVM